MVYYQSTPLIIKSEQPSQSQLCAPLRNSHLEQQHQQHLQQTSYATISNVALNIQQSAHQLHQQQQQQQLHQLQSQHQQMSQNSSINHSQHQQHAAQQQQQYLTNIKTELLPPGITLYAASPQPATSHQQASNYTQQFVANSINSISSTTPHNTQTTNSSSLVRKQNPNKPQFKCEQCGMTFGSKSAHTSHTKSHAKNGELSMLSNVNAVTNGNAMSPGVEVNEAGVPLGIPKTPQLKPNATVNGGDPYQCNVCQKTFAVPARLVSTIIYLKVT